MSKEKLCILQNLFYNRPMRTLNTQQISDCVYRLARRAGTTPPSTTRPSSGSRSGEECGEWRDSVMDFTRRNGSSGREILVRLRLGRSAHLDAGISVEFFSTSDERRSLGRNPLSEKFRELS